MFNENYFYFLKKSTFFNNIENRLTYTVIQQEMKKKNNKTKGK